MQKRRIFVSVVIILLVLILIPFSLAAQSHSYIRANGKIVADNYNNGTITQLYYYHYDALGNLVSITNSQGNVVESQRIEAFGNELQKTKTVNVSKRSFIGKEKDSNNLFYFGARYYDASTGRFISTDPLSGSQTSPETQNKYSYAVNNPLKYVDLNGKEVENPGEAYQIPGAQIATEYYANMANQPELWKQAVGQTGGFFSSLGMHPLKTAATLSGGYLAGVAVAGAAGVAASTTTTAITATEVAATTGGAAIVGETIQVATQAAPAAQKLLTYSPQALQLEYASQALQLKYTPLATNAWQMSQLAQSAGNAKVIASELAGYAPSLEKAMNFVNAVEKGKSLSFATQIFLNDIYQLESAYRALPK